MAVDFFPLMLGSIWPSLLSHISQPRWLNPSKCSTHPPSWSRPTTVTAAIKSNWVLLFLQGWATAQCRPHCVVLEGCGMAVLYGGLYLPYFILGPILCVLCWGYASVFSILYIVFVLGVLATATTQAASFLHCFVLYWELETTIFVLSSFLLRRDFSTLG